MLRSTLAFLVMVATLPAAEQVRENPYKTLKEAERLFWLDNWVKARPLYARCERAFRQRGDVKNELLARLSRLRADSETILSYRVVSRQAPNYSGSSMARPTLGRCMSSVSARAMEVRPSSRLPAAPGM
jgi:hypothetical protein